MKIIISHVYSNDNKGDAALLSVLLSDINHAFEKPDITILTLDKIKENETFEGVTVKNSFMYYVRENFHNPIIRPLYALFVATATLLWALVYKFLKIKLPINKNLREVINLYEKSDLVIPVGGGYVRGKSGFSATITLFFTIHPFLFTNILNKPTINYAQSIGPFGNKFQEFMAEFALKRVNGIIVREDISLQLLKKWKLDKNVFASIDSGFAFVSNKANKSIPELKISKEQKLVGITVRSWLKKDEQKHYEKTIAEFADHIIEKYNVFIVFIPQVTVEHHGDDDRESGQRVYSFITHKKNVHLITERHDHNVIKTIYGELDYLIGTRFHSVIFALTSYIPCIAIEYEHKTRGIMRDLSLEEWVINITKINTCELIKLFDLLVINHNSYINKLKEILPPYIKRERESIYFVKNVFNQNKNMYKKGEINVSVVIIGFFIISFFVGTAWIKSRDNKKIESVTIPIEDTVSSTTPVVVTKEPTPKTVSKNIGHAVGIAGGSSLSKLSQSELNTQLDQMVEAGITWVRFDIEWGLVQYNSPSKSHWVEYDRLIDALNARGLKSLGIIVFTPEWARDPKCGGGAKCPPKDPNQFATFAGEIVRRYKDKGVHHWEIWNEPNSYGFWATKTNCVAYTELLKTTYPVIKLNDPEAFVITGGTAPAATDGNNISRLDFLKCIYENGGKGYFDAVGDHPYTFPNLPSGNNANAWGQMSKTNPSLRGMMIANGDSDKKIWMTEFGAPTNGPDSNWYISEAKQVEMMSDTMKIYKTYDWAGPIFWYTIKDGGTSTSTVENFFGLIRIDGTPKPAYNVLKKIISSGL